MYLPVDHSLHFIGTLYFFVVWLILFLLNRDNRHEQLSMSMLGCFVGVPLQNLLYLTDWWRPLYPVGFISPWAIDLLFAFSVAGCAAVIYEVVFKRSERRDIRIAQGITSSGVLVLGALILLLAAFYGAGAHSLVATVIAGLLVSGTVLYMRRDLFFSMLGSGMLLSIVALPYYLIPLAIYPSWIEEQWLMNNLSGILLMGIPIEEYLWYLVVGLSFSALWEFTFGLRFFKKTIS